MTVARSDALARVAWPVAMPTVTCLDKYLAVQSSPAESNIQEGAIRKLAMLRVTDGLLADVSRLLFLMFYIEIFLATEVFFLHRQPVRVTRRTGLAGDPCLL